MTENPQRERWTWDRGKHPRVCVVLSPSESTAKWYDDLENAASDAVTGKVLCVVAGIAIARAVITKMLPNHQRQAEAIQVLDLADAWVDNPTDERFAQFTDFLFGDDRESTEPDDPRKVAWGALRVATSSVGNYEAGWALGIVAGDAKCANLDAVEIARIALKSRSV